MKIIAHLMRRMASRATGNGQGYTHFTALSRDENGMGRKRKKPKRFRAVTAVKELARERVGTPPTEKVIVEKKKKPEKHKPTLGKLLSETE